MAHERRIFLPILYLIIKESSEEKLSRDQSMPLKTLQMVQNVMMKSINSINLKIDEDLY
jgi:hypothetical protein